MLIKFIFVVIVISIFKPVFCVKRDYYWREYTGLIPVDAVTGGKDINGHNIYIGQAYINNEGLIVAQINPGIKEVSVPINGVKKVDRYIKILCGPPQNFQWVPSNSTDLHVVLINKHAVMGGHKDGRGHINIGRISYHGDRIGKVDAFNVGDAKLFMVDGGSERDVKSYEVLCYGDEGFDIKNKPIVN